MNWLKPKFVWGGVVTTATLLLAASVQAQEPATVVLLDRNAIAPGSYAAVDINATIADVGVRDALPYFNTREGQAVTLPAGEPGHEGWLAFTAIPAGWTVNEDTDGLENLIWAGPGLGSPDATGNRTALLGTKAEIVPLGPTGLQSLVGRTVCALVFAGELPRSAAGINVSGATLGILALTVDAVTGSAATALPSLEVTVRETRQVCGGALTPMLDAPTAGM